MNASLNHAHCVANGLPVQTGLALTASSASALSAESK